MDEPRQSRARKALLACVVALGVLAVLEGGLRIAAAASARVAEVLSEGTPRTLPDPRLGKRPNPALPDHDRAGWRNAQRPERVDLVAIGDSQTYGDEVAREEAWPQQLARHAGLRTYNLALGGYGPLQYERLLDEALALSPERVVVGLYAGNDLAEAYSAAVREGLAPDAGSESERAALLAIDARRGDLATRWRETKAARRGRIRNRLDAVLDPLRAHSRLAGLVRGLERLPRRSGDAPFATGPRKGFAHYAARAAGADPALLLPVGHGGLGTILTPASRAALLDRDDPRVAFGLDLTLAAIGRMARRLPHGALHVVLIPTKELVFAPLAQSSGAPLPEAYRMLIRDETWLWGRVEAVARELGVSTIPVLPALREALAERRNPYPPDWNGHPNAAGNDAIARAVAAGLARTSR